MPLKSFFIIEPTGAHYTLSVSGIAFAGLTWSVLYLIQSYNGFPTLMPLYFGLWHFGLAAAAGFFMYRDYRKNCRAPGLPSRRKLLGAFVISAVIVGLCFRRCFGFHYYDTYLDGRKWYFFGCSTVVVYLFVLSVLTLSIRRR